MSDELFGKSAIDSDEHKEAQGLSNKIAREGMSAALDSLIEKKKDVCGKCTLSWWRHRTVIRECRHPVVGGDLPYEGKESCNFQKKSE